VTAYRKAMIGFIWCGAVIVGSRSSFRLSNTEGVEDLALTLLQDSFQDELIFFFIRPKPYPLPAVNILITSEPTEQTQFQEFTP
jgi:hypothetical protein